MAQFEIIPIRKNSRKLKAIWEKGTNAQRFDQDNYFNGSPVALKYVKETYERFDGKLTWSPGRQRYTVHIHSNLFYHFDGPDPREL